MRELSFLINPAAGSAGRWQRVAASLKQLRPEAEVLVARQPGDLFNWARERRDAIDQVVVGVGGDGTVHQVGNGLLGGQAIFGVYAAGTGNDFAKMLDVPGELEAAVSFFESARPRPCDVGRVEIEHVDGAVTNACFINSLGLGLEALIADTAARARLLRGFSRYLVAAMWRALGHRPQLMRLAHEGFEIEQRQFLVAVGNGCCAGGRFRLFPQARIDDGLFDLVWVDSDSRLRLLRILPTVLTGGHLRFSDVHHDRVRQVAVYCAAGCAVHADGEVLARKARAVRVRVLPGALQVLG